MMFRSVALPAGIKGALLLHSMPGRTESLEQAWDGVESAGVSCMVSLTDFDEMRMKSPQYAEAVIAGSVPCDRIEYPIVDFGVPNDRESFWSFVQTVGDRLRAGQRLLVHCGAGIGRTGTFAICLLLALGVAPKAAEHAVSSAGSEPETSDQRSLVAWCASRAGDADEV